MTSPTLRSSANNILFATFALIIVGSGAVIVGYANVQESMARNQALDEVTRSLPNQIDSIIPSFLLPEQKDGANLILERIKTSEDLSSISIENSPLESHAKNCTQSAAVMFCKTNGEIMISTPITESGRTYGYLVKVKKANHVTSSDLLKTFLLTSSILFVAFLGLFVMLARLLKQIPTGLTSLVNWIEDDLSGKHPEKPDFKIADLNNLAKSISEVIGRHDRARDQAIVGQLTSGIMHDIKTPLASVVAATSLALEQPKDSPKRNSRLENLLNVCEARLPIIGDIIESTLDGNREIHVEKSNCSLKKTIQNSLGLTNDLSLNRKAKVTFVEMSEEITAPHDSVQIARVLTNLIKNGLEAAQSRTEPKLRIAVEALSSEIKISVEDNGPGISGQTDNVFRVFRSTKSHGSGLGLLISKKIIEAHEGRIDVGRSSRLGGAKFEVFLPNYISLNEVTL